MPEKPQVIHTYSTPTGGFQHLPVYDVDDARTARLIFSRSPQAVATMKANILRHWTQAQMMELREWLGLYQPLSPTAKELAAKYGINNAAPPGQAEVDLLTGKRVDVEPLSPTPDHG